MPYEWNFSIVLQYLPRLLTGGAYTIVLSAACIALAAPIGILFGIVRYLRIPVLTPIAVVYIDFFRDRKSVV